MTEYVTVTGFYTIHEVCLFVPIAGGDESYITWNANLWPSFITLYRKDKDPKIRISNTFFPNVLAMTKIPE